MALTQCRECNGHVAKNAKTCPHCGINSPGNKVRAAADAMQEAGQGIAAAGCLLLLVPLLFLIFVGPCTL